ncbi:MAG: DUF4838 domain-containing protein [Lentisphaeria bacterium]|nr:DUF4838 domain-containing protein [Lentisphaeria bacterium]
MLKKLLLSAAAVAALTLAGAMPQFAPKAVSPRRCVLGKTPGHVLVTGGKVNFEIVVKKNAVKAVRFAAEELAGFMGQAVGAKIPVVSAPSGTKCAILVGDREAAAAAGLDLEHLDRDGFFIKSFKGNIIIIGNDDKHPRAATESFRQLGTLYGVYDFLERFCGVRFYFPGPMGTIVPAKKELVLPAIDIADRPDNQFRQIYCIELKELNKGKGDYLPESMKKLNVGRTTNHRTRMSTLKIPNCHGLAYLGLVQRFAKSHPEYFALRDDGGRMDGTHITAPSTRNGHLCFTSNVKEEIYQDAAAFLSGKPASSRNVLMPNGKVYWNGNFFSQPFFNIMPNDGMYHCRCEKCKVIYAQGDQAVSNHIWKFKTDIARRLIQNNIPGYITVMAYGEYRLIPDMEIPDNVIVHLALTGPWNELNPKAQKESLELLEAWHKKLNRKTYLWTYITKCGNKIEDIPPFTPRAVGSFFKKSAPHSFGAFLEAETDHWMFGFLNLYVFGKVMWNNDSDVNALIDEHCRLMYGAGAPMMKEVYAAWEKHWLKDIMSNIRETSVGPQAVIPSKYDIWHKIYPATEIARIDALFDKAEKAAAKDRDALARIKFIRKELWGKVHDGRREYDKANNDRRIWTAYMPETAEKIVIDGKLSEKAWAKAEPVHMVLRKGTGPIDVSTQVRLLCDKENFYVGFECEEPFTDIMLEAKRQKDDIELWRDNLVELFFAPDPRSEVLYQIMLGSNGCVSDMRWVLKKNDMKWNSDLEYKPGVVSGKKWIAEVRIPRSSMPELKDKKSFMANFTRGRMIKGKTLTPYYVWTPFPKQNPENCGVVRIGPKPEDKSLIKHGDFTRPVYHKRFLGNSQGTWYGQKILVRDTKVFRTGGASMLIPPEEGLYYYFKKSLKPNTRYRWSYSVKLEDVKARDRYASGFYGNLRMGGVGTTNQIVSLPEHAMTGTNDWIRLEVEFTTTPDVGKKSEPYLGLYLRHATGKAWVDNVRLEEVGPRP